MGFCYIGLMERKDLNKKMPDSPGVYKFVGPKKEILYVGKATSLKDRVKSYFVSDIREIRSPLIEKIVKDAVRGGGNQYLS